MWRVLTEDAVTDNNAGRGEMIELTEVRYSHADDSVRNYVSFSLQDDNVTFQAC